MSDIGLLLSGGQLSRVPPEASAQEQTASINTIIDKLNTWNGVIVGEGTKAITISDALQQSFTVPHNLGYAPVPFAFLNRVGLSITGSTTLNLPLPTFITATLTGGQVVDTSRIIATTDATNMYIVVFNATGAAIGNFVVSYYLMRITAAK